MTLIALRCPHCHSADFGNGGKVGEETENGDRKDGLKRLTHAAFGTRIVNA
ncbi:hypothetical protein FACS18942_06780 [Planctomycetales bacterium]|nr:hypothetical protein FACS18942_06780 [Planctomycetales bacterium]